MTARPPRPPDLQELVARHGGYDKITPEAWAKYDCAMADWHVRRREAIARDLGISPLPRRVVGGRR
jgi:hypothetical protein